MSLLRLSVSRILSKDWLMDSRSLAVKKAASLRWPRRRFEMSAIHRGPRARPRANANPDRRHHRISKEGASRQCLITHSERRQGINLHCWRFIVAANGQKEQRYQLKAIVKHAVHWKYSWSVRIEETSI